MEVSIEPLALESLRRLKAEWVAEGARLEGQQARTELARVQLETAARSVLQRLVPGAEDGRIDLDRGVVSVEGGSDDDLSGNA